MVSALHAVESLVGLVISSFIDLHLSCFFTGLVCWERTSLNLLKLTVMPNMFGVSKGKFFR